MIRKKEISWGVLLSFAAQAVSIIVGLVYTPIMTKILGQNEFGLYQLVQSVVNYLNLMNFGFNGAYIRYYSLAKRNNDEKKISDINGMFMKIFLVIMVLCLVGGAIIFCNISLLGDKLTDSDYAIAKRLLVIMVITLAVSFPNSLFVAYMSANEKFVFQKILNIIINVLTPLMTIPLLLLGYGSVGMVAIALFLTIGRIVANGVFCVKKINLKINIRFFDKRIFISLLGYTFFIFLSDLVDQLNSNVDKFLLGRLMGTIAVAIYSVGFNLKNYFVLVSWIVPEMYIPEVNQLAVRGNSDTQLSGIFTKIGKLNNYFLLLILSGFFLLGQQFITLWVGNEYSEAYIATLILMVAGYIPAVQTLGVNIQNAKNMHKVRSIVYFAVACINVVSSILLIKAWGVIGTCIGTLVATLFGHGLFMNIYYQKKVGLDIGYFWKELLKWFPPVLGLTLIGWIVLRYISIDNWFKLIVFAVIYTAIYVVLLYFVGMRRNQRQIVQQKVSNFLLQKGIDLHKLSDRKINAKVKRKINDGQRINVLFVCHRPAVWGSLRSVYEFLKTDQRFDVQIVAIPNKKELPEDGLNHEFYESEGAEEFWAEYGCLNGYDYTTGKWLDLRNLNPDYIFFQQPYNITRCPAYKSWEVSKYAKLCYIAYATDFIGEGILEETTPADFMHDVYVYFTQNQIDDRLVTDILKGYGNTYTQTIMTGFPRIELIYKYKGSESDIWSYPRDGHKFRVLWTPRWCTNEGNCSFFDYKDLFPELCTGDTDYDFVFRPHPQAFLGWNRTGELPEEDAKKYISLYNEASNMAIDNSREYYSTIFSSDCLISDVSSFIADYFLTGKPIIYCHKKDMFNDFSRKMAEGFYWVSDWKELKDVLSKLKMGEDPLFEKRQVLRKELMLEIAEGETASEKIRDFIIQDVYKC